MRQVSTGDLGLARAQQGSGAIGAYSTYFVPTCCKKNCMELIYLYGKLDELADGQIDDLADGRSRLRTRMVLPRRSFTLLYGS